MLSFIPSCDGDHDTTESVDLVEGAFHLATPFCISLLRFQPIRCHIIDVPDWELRTKAVSMEISAALLTTRHPKTALVRLLTSINHNHRLARRQASILQLFHDVVQRDD